MNRLRTALMLAAAIVPATATGQAAEPANAIFSTKRSDALPHTPAIALAARKIAKPIASRKIILVGDSTVANRSGWGGTFCAEHVAPTLTCINLGRGGRSTRSYREEGSWQMALNEASAKGYEAIYVLIQFGHNDGNPRMSVRTDLEPEYRDNLVRFIQDLRSVGATPVLVTPMVRRLFDEQGFHNSLAPWANVTRSVAADHQVKLVDLNAHSAALVTQLGAEEAAKLAPVPLPPVADDAAPRYYFKLQSDPTHLGGYGAKRMAEIIAQQLALNAPDLAQHIAP